MSRRFTARIVRLAIVLAALVILASAPSAPLRAAPVSQDNLSSITASLHAFKLLTPQDGWALLGNKVYATRTGGQGWQDITPPDLGSRSVSTVHFLDMRRGWVLLTEAGDLGEPRHTLTVTSDGGASWRAWSLDLFAWGELEANIAKAHLYFVDPSVGWLVFQRATGPNFDVGTLFRTTDGGQTWTRLPIPIGDAVYFATPEMGWVAGGAAGDELYRTQDGGATWERQDVPGPAVSGRRAYSLPRFDDPQTGQIPVVISTAQNSRVAFYQTRDGGKAWVLAQEAPLNQELPIGAPLPLALIDARGWSLVVPTEGRILVPEQGGGVAVTSGADALATGIVALDMATAQAGWARYAAGTCASSPEGLRCTQETRLLRTENGGRTWAALPLPADAGKATMVSTVPYSEMGGASMDLTQPITGQAFDSCTLPSVSQMRNWFLNSPYRVWNLYIGGSSRAACGTLTASHVAQLSQQGWRLIPTWVGPQASCTTFRTRMSQDQATAYAQGVSEANEAIAVASSLGLTRPDGTGTMIYYDLEAYDVTNQPCREAAKSFMAGWSAQLHARGLKSGVYGSACSSALTDFATLPQPPDGVWIAAWIKPYEYRPEATVWNVTCLANSLWSSKQRLRQYSGGHNETWGGLTLNIDSNVLDGIVAALNPPHVPSNPNPADGASTPRNVILSWSGGDPDPGDTISYRVYLEKNADPITAVCEGPATTCAVVNLTPNTDYYWRVVATDQRGMTSSSPVWRLRTAVLVNDDLPNALTIAALPYSNEQETTEATVAGDDPVLGCVTARKYNTVWYRYTPSSHVTLEISTEGSSYDTVLGVWTGARGALEAVACNDDAAPGQKEARVRVSAAAGTTYLIEAAGYTAGGGSLRLSVAETDATTTVSIAPPARSVSVGDVFTASVQVAAVANLGSYQGTLVYEPGLLRVEAVTLGDFLGSTGRSVMPRAPVIDNATGRATFGAYTTGAAPAGPDGAGILAMVRLRALAQGLAHLALEGAEVADVTGKRLAIEVMDGAALIVPCEGDFDADGEIDAEDIQSVAYRWNTECGQANYNGFYDLDENCRVNIADVQRVAGRWGVRCAASRPDNTDPAGESSTSTTIVAIQPSGQLVSQGETFTVQVSAANATDLGAIEFTLGYDAERLELVNVQSGDLLGSTGRAITAVGPHSDAKAGVVLYGLYSVGHSVPGACGDGVLAQVTFRARRAGPSMLALREAQVTDVIGAPSTVLVQHGGVMVVAGSERVWLPVLVSAGH